MSTNRQWWEPTWATIYDLPAKVRIALKYGDIEAACRSRMADGWSPKKFYNACSKPSQDRNVKYLRNVEKERLVKLYPAEYDTIIPKVGYKTKHFRSGEDVYVIETAFGAEIKRDDARPQEYVQIVSKLEWGWVTGNTHAQKFQETVLARQHHVGLRYIDKLTKKHREALTLLKIMDVDGYVDGIGYRKSFNKYKGYDQDSRMSLYQDVVLYFIDAVKREEDEQ